MSAGVYRAIVRGPWWTSISPKTPGRYHTKPPKKEVGLFETIVGFSVLSLGLLSPAAWILCHLPEQPKH